LSRATMRTSRGLRCSMNRLIVPPWPVASRQIRVGAASPWSRGG
jgi:hypothetical protein